MDLGKLNITCAVAISQNFNLFNDGVQTIVGDRETRRAVSIKQSKKQSTISAAASTV